MTQPFADALTWVPKSRALSATLGRAHDLARAQNQPAVLLEHLLLALIEDPDASAVLLSCNIDLLKLNAAAAAYVQAQPNGSSDMPEASPALRAILEYAVAAARQSRRNEINGAIVLAALVGEGKSEAAKLLGSAGLTFQSAVLALKKSAAPAQRASSDAPARPEVQPQPLAPSTPPPPPATPPPIPPVASMPAASPETSRGPSPAPPAPSTPGHHAFDEDPVSTARRRIAAIRNGQVPPPLGSGNGGPSIMAAPIVDGNAAVAFAPSSLEARPPPLPVGPAGGASGGDWTPTAVPHPASRPVRMPPPVPPVSDAPVRRPGATGERMPSAKAPWSDGAAAEVTGPSTGPSASRPSIDTARLAERLPVKLTARTPTTIEVRIPRAAVLATAAASSAGTGRGPIVTRAIAVRLKAPMGGCSVENASPETQWFDAQATQREDDEVRWRWVVTPNSRGRLPLQLSISMRTVTADGMIMETVLPEQLATVKVASSPRAAASQLATWGLAAFVGSILTLLASVGLAGLLGGVFK